MCTSAYNPVLRKNPLCRADVRATDVSVRLASAETSAGQMTDSLSFAFLGEGAGGRSHDGFELVGPGTHSGKAR